MRLRITLAYDGTAFHGWAKQTGLRTVQGELEDALETMFRTPIDTVVAGRTDAGVHAENQTVHVDVPTEAMSSGDPQRMVTRANNLLAAGYSKWRRPLVTRGYLPSGVVIKGESDVVVKTIEVVSDAFDARFSADQRHYRYRLVDTVADRKPTRRNDEWWLPTGAVDVGVMARATDLLVGEHDYLSFCKPREGASTVRTLGGVEVRREDGAVTVGVWGDAFCHNMVRSIVGALVEVGRGVRGREWVGRLLSDPSRAHGVPVAPARGLTLVTVTYPAEERWAAQAHEARILRGTTPQKRVRA